MTRPPPALIPALDALRSGDVARARAAVEELLDRGERDTPVLALGAMLAGQAGDHRLAAERFGELHRRDPDDLGTRINLARALLSAGDIEAAEAVAEGSGDPRLLKIAGYAAQELGEPARAARCYNQVVNAAPEDFASWNNLGNARAALGQVDQAIAAFERAISLNRREARPCINLSRLLGQHERVEPRRRVMRDALAAVPDDPEVLLEHALAEAQGADVEGAEAALRRAIALRPGFADAYLELALLLETGNRVDALAELTQQARAEGLGEGELAFLEAWTLRRQGRDAEALSRARGVPDRINPIRREQLLAELCERLGDAEGAIPHYVAMNAAAVDAAPPLPGPSYRETVEARSQLLTPTWVAGWTELPPPAGPASPAFLLGFPRSGTTLIDTLLMNLPRLHVTEELAMLPEVEWALGDEQRLAELTADERDALRQRYFEALHRLSPPASGQMVVDKHPLHMARVPLIHRLFPDARLILVERHPCDVVLSCWMANFRLNHAMRSFTTVEEAARTYDAVWTCWTRAVELLPVTVHRVRYEAMVADPAAELKPLVSFLGQDWRDDVLDNVGSAGRRKTARTASYSQVTEPIYRHAAGRWHRYRTVLDPVLPILAPWVERMATNFSVRPGASAPRQ